jgi:hypothetical protein
MQSLFSFTYSLIFHIHNALRFGGRGRGNWTANSSRCSLCKNVRLFGIPVVSCDIQ